MRQGLFLWIALLGAAVLTGCTEEVLDRRPQPVEVVRGDLAFVYTLETDNGTEATVFREGETVVTRFTVKNNSTDTLYMAYVYSLPEKTWRFGFIYDALTDEAVYDPGISQQPFEPCRHIAPGGEQTWTKECRMEYGMFLHEGDYYGEFQPNFGYYETCGHEMEDNIPMQVVELPKMRVDFTVVQSKK